nr:type II toxin-antitoxin system PemK/MazF family toxin [uncultured Rhodopila sp.]
MATFKAGDIVIADWRGGALPKEPNKLRPAVVIEDETLFAPNYPNVILVPLTEDAGLAIPGLMEPIEPSPENGCTKRCYALAPFVASTSAERIRATRSRITPDQLARIRRQVGEAIGLG